MPLMRCVRGVNETLITGNIYNVIRQYHEDGEDFVSVVTESGGTESGWYANRFEQVDQPPEIPKVYNVKTDIFRHHKKRSGLL